MARKVITRINGGTKTVAAVFSQPSEQWTPDWDKAMSNEQGMRRARKRAEMGQKKTPIGAGKLIKRG